MSEWKRHRGSKSMPKCLVGKKYEAMRRDGDIAAFVNSWIHYGRDSDVMKYRIMPSEPAAEPAKPNYSNGFPKGTTAKDIGAKVGDGFVVVCGDNRFKNGDVVKLAKDDGSDLPWFSFDGNFSELTKHCMYWHELAPIPQKTAIELQAEEVGIPEPVQLVDDSQPDAGGWIEWKGGECPVDGDEVVSYRMMDGAVASHVAADLRWKWNGWDSDITAYRPHQPQEWPEDRIDVIGQNGNTGEHYEPEMHLGVKRPDGDGWVKYNAGDAVDINGVMSIDWADRIGYANTCLTPHELRWADGESDQIAWYRLNYADAQQSAEADKLIDDAAQKLRESFGSKVATTEPVTASEFLQSALNTLTQRGKDYDKPEGERSAAAVAVAFNAITGKQITDAEVYLVLQLVKDVRQWQCDDFHADSALDCVAYAALKAEALAWGGK